MSRHVTILRQGMWVAAVALLFAGCGRDAGRLDAEDRALPAAQKAEKKCMEGDYPAAVELYEEALIDHPRAARIHLDLALLLHDHTDDLIGGIYHYRRYLALRPSTEKNRMIDDRIRMAMQQLGAKGRGVEEQQVERIEALERENTALRLQAEKLDAELKKSRIQLAELQKASPAAMTTAAPDRRTVPTARPKTYRVKRGDSLGSIARELYGDASKWRDIYEANKAEISDYDHVPAGQVLKIP